MGIWTLTSLNLADRTIMVAASRLPVVACRIAYAILLAGRPGNESALRRALR